MMVRYILLTIAMVVLGLVLSPTASAATSGGGDGASSGGSGSCDGRLLTLPTWHRGLTDGSCKIKSPEKTENGLRDFIAKIILNITEAIMQLVGYASVLFLIIGGFRYMFTAADPEQVSKGKTTIRNAIIGLLISLFAVAIVNVIFRTLT